MLVTDAERGSSICVIRSLGRAGYRVIAADSAPNSIGFRSRYVHETLVYPSPQRDPQGFIDCLLRAAIDREIDLIIPVTEPVIQPIAEARETIERIAAIALPSNSRLSVVTDKLRTIEMAKELGIPVPNTIVVNSAQQALRVAGSLTWPVVVKPNSSARLMPGSGVEKFEVSYASCPEQLLRLVQGYEGRCSVLLQEYCPGMGYGVELLMDKGDPIAAFSHRRLREFPITGGASSFRESVKLDERLYGYSVSLLRKIEWTGLAMVEYKVEGAEPVLMEINGRVWGSLPLAVHSGVDFPLLMTRLFLDGRDAVLPQSNDDYKIGLRCRDLQKDLMWIACVLIRRRKHAFLNIPKRMEALGALVSLLSPVQKFDLWSLDDPLPAFAELPKIFRKFTEKLDP